MPPVLVCSKVLFPLLLICLLLFFVVVFFVLFFAFLFLCSDVSTLFIVACLYISALFCKTDKKPEIQFLILPLYTYTGCHVRAVLWLYWNSRIWTSSDVNVTLK